jgi:hypothetical protein
MDTVNGFLRELPPEELERLKYESTPKTRKIQNVSFGDIFIFLN